MGTNLPTLWLLVYWFVPLLLARLLIVPITPPPPPPLPLPLPLRPPSDRLLIALPWPEPKPRCSRLSSILKNLETEPNPPFSPLYRG